MSTMSSWTVFLESEPVKSACIQPDITSLHTCPPARLPVCLSARITLRARVPGGMLSYKTGIIIQVNLNWLFTNFLLGTWTHTCISYLTRMLRRRVFFYKKNPQCTGSRPLLKLCDRQEPNSFRSLQVLT